MSLGTLAQRRSRSASERVGGCICGFVMTLHCHRASSRQGGRLPDSVLLFDGARPTRWGLTMIRNWRLLVAAALLGCCGAAAQAHAQSYPSRPITIVVPYPAGGVTDNLVRLLAERMKNSLGQSIVIENIGGGGGTIGVDRVSRAAPDGYTLVLGNSESMVFAPVTMAISYNALTDFEPVALLPSYPFLLVTTNDVPAKNLEGLIAWFKASPEKVLQGTVGAGTMQHLCGLLLQKTT